MSYARPNDLAYRYGSEEIARLGDGPKIEAALTDAAAEIDAVLGEAFTLPLGRGPHPALTAIACLLARLHLYDEAAPEGIVAGARQARKLLRAIADGKAVLADAHGVVVQRSADAVKAPRAAGPGPVMTAEALRGL